MNVTISELAKQLNVSPMTVSRALRGVGRIGVETRQKILKAAEEMGYKPNRSARAMRSGKTGCLALLLGGFNDSGYLAPDIAWGIQDELASKDLHLYLARLTFAARIEDFKLPEILQQHMVDGLLINYTYGTPPSIVERLNKLEIPAVWLNVNASENCVYPDDQDGGRQAVKYLIGLGHSKIAYIDFHEPEADPAKRHYSISARFQGYEQGMKEAGLTPMHVTAPSERAKQEAFYREWLKGSDRPTAIVGYDEWAAEPCIYAAGNAGLNVPGDLCFVVFNNSPFERMGIKIPTMLVPNHDMGREGVKMILERIKSPGQALPSRKNPVRMAYQDAGAGPKK
jgi:LacI family transcriptional regulator